MNGGAWWKCIAVVAAGSGGSWAGEGSGSGAGFDASAGFVAVVGDAPRAAGAGIDPAAGDAVVDGRFLAAASVKSVRQAQEGAFEGIEGALELQQSDERGTLAMGVGLDRLIAAEAKPVERDLVKEIDLDRVLGHVVLLIKADEWWYYSCPEASRDAMAWAWSPAFWAVLQVRRFGFLVVDVVIL